MEEKRKGEDQGGAESRNVSLFPNSSMDKLRGEEGTTEEEMLDERGGGLGLLPWHCWDVGGVRTEVRA